MQQNTPNTTTLQSTVAGSGGPDRGSRSPPISTDWRCGDHRWRCNEPGSAPRSARLSAGRPRTTRAARPGSRSEKDTPRARRSFARSDGGRLAEAPCRAPRPLAPSRLISFPAPRTRPRPTTNAKSTFHEVRCKAPPKTLLTCFSSPSLRLLARVFSPCSLVFSSFFACCLLVVRAILASAVPEILLEPGDRSIDQDPKGDPHAIVNPGQAN